MQTSLFRLLILLIVALPTIGAAQELSSSTPSCRKNVIIYFDASGSMTAQKEGRTLRELMSEFLEKAINLPDFLSDADLLTIKRFVYKPALIPGTKLHDVVPLKNRREFLETVVGKLMPTPEERQNDKGPNGKPDTDFLVLLDDIEKELDLAPESSSFGTYILIFSDFLYNPTGGGELDWDRHQAAVSERLNALQGKFDAKHARLILVYQENPSTDGRNMIGEFASRRFAKRIDDIEDIPRMVNQVTRAFRQPPRISEDGNDFRYSTAQGLMLNLLIENSNCVPVQVNRIQLGPIKSALSESVPFSADRSLTENIKEGTHQSILVPLSNAPKAPKDLEAYLNQYFEVPYSISTDAGLLKGKIKLQITADTFSEDLKFDLKAVQLRHMIPWFNRLFLQMVPNGNLVRDRILKVKVDAQQSYSLRLLEPESKILKSTTPLESQSSLFVFELSKKNDNDEDYKLTEVSVQWSVEPVTTHSSKLVNLKAIANPGQQTIGVQTKDLRWYEIAAVLIVFILAVVLRVLLGWKKVKRDLRLEEL